jgi:hypothetical protein
VTRAIVSFPDKSVTCCATHMTRKGHQMEGLDHQQSIVTPDPIWVGFRLRTASQEDVPSTSPRKETRIYINEHKTRGKTHHESIVEGSKDVSHAEHVFSLPHSRPESHILLLLYSYFLLPRLHAQKRQQNNQKHIKTNNCSPLLFLPTNGRFSSFVDSQAKRPRNIHQV